MIEPGAEAPDFTLPDHEGNQVTLSELRGKKVVLVFYPLDFSRLCTDQLNLYQDVLTDLEDEGVQLFGISVDSAFCHFAFREKLGLTFPLLADFNPKGAVAEKYGVYLAEAGISSRALVLIDEEGKVLFAHQTPTIADLPVPSLIFDALAPAAPA